jgi:hypothetical protein
VSRDFLISKENCQQAKVLSSQTQRDERIQMMKDIKKRELEKKISLYCNESKKYNENQHCEERIINYFISTSSTTSNTTSTIDPDTKNRIAFMDIAAQLTHEHFGRHKHKGFSNYKPSAQKLKSFIHVRQVANKFKGKAPIYKSFKGIKKEELIDMCYDLRQTLIQVRQFEDP